MKGSWTIRWGVFSWGFPDWGEESEQHVLALLRKLGQEQREGPVTVIYTPAANHIEPEKEFDAWGVRVR